MACIEASLVVYLRELYYPDDRRTIFPLRLMSNEHLAFEFPREVATLLMILSVSWLSEKNAMRRFAAFVFVFGLWDVFYYVWLKAFIGWPVSFTEWDVLFLIPWPWFGPWMAAAAIAVLFTAWGGWVLSSDHTPLFNRRAVLPFVAGALAALAAFLLPGWPLLALGAEGFRGYVPGSFAWWLYIPGWIAMAAGLIVTRRAH
jgi:hypothetical protein